MEINKIYNEDCLKGIKRIADESVDMILCDLPYGTTQCKWDTVIPFKPLWEQYKRVIRRNRAIVLTGTQPFTSSLIMSNVEWFKYEWIWKKNNATGFVNAKLKPMNIHENILVFSNGKTSNGNKNNMLYNPQGLVPFNKEVRSGNKQGKDNTYWRPSLLSSNKGGHIQEFTNYPKTCLEFAKDKAVHPTQKPVALFEYLIKTYTNPGELVLDNCMGSGTTAIACMNTERNFIGFEMDKGYYDIACKRIEEHEEAVNGLH